MSTDADPLVLIEQLRQQNADLEKSLKRVSRDVSRLKGELDRERALSLIKSNHNAVRTLEQREHEKYMRLLLANTPNALLLMDKNCRLVYCTDAFLQMSRINHIEKINGRTLREIFKQFSEHKWPDEYFEIIEEAERANKPASFKDPDAIMPNGDIHKFEVHYAPMLDVNGSIEGSLIICHDVTEIERMRQKAEQASIAKSDFLSNMSHEMRTPLNAVIGMTNIAKASKELNRKDYCLGKINEASVHLLGVINDILDMSKIEANKLDLSNTEFNFEQMIIKMVNVINFRVDEKHQNLMVKIAENVPRRIISDDQHLAQVIANLLSNAVKFTPEGGKITLEASLVEEESASCVLQIRVIDTGIGVTKEQAGRLFQSFQQADSSTSRQFGGTGLGLAISKAIVEKMEGTIWVESEYGQGSTFAFTFRTEKGANEENDSLLSPLVNLETMRTLVVDDDPVILEYMEIIALQLGISCDYADSGEAACKLIEEKGIYDLYFIDWKMPGMDGIELARRIKAKSAGKSIVIMISGADLNKVEAEAKDAGISKFIQKPIFASAIAETINDCLHVSTKISQDSSGSQTSNGSKASDQGHDDNCFLGYHIMLAEDIEINREIVQALMEPTGIKIDYAENGKVAVDLFSKNHGIYNAILMDVQMPEMDGYQATRTIRGIEESRALQSTGPVKPVPIIAMTANVFREDIEKCLASGMNDHVGKPLDMNDVMAKLRKYL
ncbi:response regulator [Leadbettera azotonutricia]|uniref:histidine kinase n=1 Tax=Leadbettera azotonutricia (strain ATCC BAA-888 / DSM 13862 / ZAS-9) TaxID=545695 RepID=F5YFU3_LEAAZ|nr:response regulator [Leadbettera azotonutricia]AEF81791.1 multi-sensor hybrid histidine kinase [Leadbettera azotonutricia ZAS-9]